MMIDDSSTPSFNPLFRLQWEKAQDCYVLLYPEGMIKLNPSAGEILALVDGSRAIAQIIQTLQQKFSDIDSLDDDVREFIGVAYEQNWIRLH